MKHISNHISNTKAAWEIVWRQAKDTVWNQVYRVREISYNKMWRPERQEGIQHSLVAINIDKQ